MNDIFTLEYNRTNTICQGKMDSPLADQNDRRTRDKRMKREREKREKVWNKGGETF